MIGALVARKAVARAFDALNRRDLQAFMAGWRDDVVFVYPGDVPESGNIQGRRAIDAWFRRYLDQFPTLQFDVRDICVRNLFDLVGTNVVVVHWNLRLVNRDGRHGQNSGVTVVGIERGKVVHIKDYVFNLGDGFRRDWSAPPSPPRGAAPSFAV